MRVGAVTTAEDLPSHSPERRLIEGRGTDEARWNASVQLDRMSYCNASAWAASYRRVWLVAPHPDDEVLALGGTLAQLTALNVEVRVVSVSDGEASHGDSPRWTHARLAETRAKELRRALDALGIDAEVIRLRLPDGRIGAHRQELLKRLVDEVGEQDLLLATCRFDGHPDHEACGEVALLVAELTGAAGFEYPVWMWHWATPEEPLIPWARARRVALSPELVKRKSDAIRQFASQIHTDGDRAAVLPPHVLPRFERPFEVVFT